MLSVQDHSLAGQVLMGNEVDRGNRVPWLARRILRVGDKSFEMADKSYHGQDVVKRRQLFGLPSLAGMGRKTTPMGLLSLFAMALAAVAFFGQTQHPGLVFGHLFGVWYLLVISCMSIASWVWRRELFGWELCRPASRRDFIDDLFAVRFREMASVPIGSG